MYVLMVMSVFKRMKVREYEYDVMSSLIIISLRTSGNVRKSERDFPQTSPRIRIRVYHFATNEYVIDKYR